MRSTRCEKLVRLARGEGKVDKEVLECIIPAEFSDNLSSPRSPDLKNYLTEDKIFTFPISFEKLDITHSSINEYAGSNECIQNFDLQDLLLKLFDKSVDDLDLFEDSDDSVKARGEGKVDKEVLECVIPAEFSDNLSSPRRPDLKNYLTEDKIFTFPISFEKLDITHSSINEYAGSNEFIKNFDLQDLLLKLFDKSVDDLDLFEDSDDSVKDKDYVPPSDINLSNSYDEFDDTTDNNDIPTLLEPPLITAEPTIQHVPECEGNLTKSGKKRMRQKFETTLEDRVKEKKDRIKTKHKVINYNTHNCRKRCREAISELECESLNIKMFWNMTWREQKVFIANRIVSKEPIRRNKTPEFDYKRKKTLEYSFIVREKVQSVCKEFFLNTLGFKKDNNSAINVALKIEKDFAVCSDKRGTNPKKKFDRQLLREHIESYNPAISHYRREHAPNRRYLPHEMTAQKMYDDFCNINGKICSYDLYRETVKSMNISFAKLGNEECDRCESYKIHNINFKTIRHFKCDICKQHDRHLEIALSARLAYQSTKSDDKTVCFSADLQKVIMLPRMESIKLVAFCPRIIVFNESFVPVGQSKDSPMAFLWHEAISGRKKEDILSSFRRFFTELRDAQNIILWLDNCAGQNKNWCLFSFIVYIINSGELTTETITLNFFEPGHTFMSADSFHHQVELE